MRTARRSESLYDSDSPSLNGLVDQWSDQLPLDKRKRSFQASQVQIDQRCGGLFVSTLADRCAQPNIRKENSIGVRPSFFTSQMVAERYQNC